jgi:hypothetical protein
MAETVAGKDGMLPELVCQWYLKFNNTVINSKDYILNDRMM